MADLSSSSSASSSSDEEFDDPRSDLENYKEILLTGCPAEKHLEYHDVDPYSIIVDKFRVKCVNEMKSDPIHETRELYDKIRIEFTEKMSDTESEAFSAALSKVAQESIMRKLREVKENAIGKMPTSQG